MECELCNNKNIVFLFKSKNIHGRHLLSDDVFDVCECKNCGIVFTDITADSGYYQKYYPLNYYSSGQYNFFLGRVFSVLQKLSFLQKLRLIKKYAPQGISILEIGCAKGYFLHKLPSYFEKYGVEINENAYSYAKKHYKDITLYNERIESTSFAGKNRQYDVIVIWHVLEHIDNPDIFFESIAKLLAKDGVIILEVPNRDSIGFNLTKKHWFHLDTPRHLFHYNYKSLNSLLKKYNFKILKYKGSLIDYCQDLISSLYMKFKTNNCFLDSIMLAVIVPLAFSIRLVAALFIPAVSEINTYIIKHI